MLINMHIIFASTQLYLSQMPQMIMLKKAKMLTEQHIVTWRDAEIKMSLTFLLHRWRILFD